ncbi:MAG TPA: chaperone modulator CbpM [Bacteroidales bacterium]|nr:chaperone modulator CbpM [Bacteroidales bacterium]
MKNVYQITAMEFCSVNNIDPAFILTLDESGILRFEHSGDDLFINHDQLPKLEKIIMLHYDLDINLEGIETILHLLERSEQMKKELSELRNRLRLYEDLDLFND